MQHTQVRRHDSTGIAHKEDNNMQTMDNDQPEEQGVFQRKMVEKTACAQSGI